MRSYLGGPTNTVIHTHADGSMTVEERQDAQPILDSNQRSRDHRFPATKDFREAFDIPMVVALRWERECGHKLGTREWDVYMNLQCKRPEFAYLVAAPKMRDPRIRVTGAR